MVAYGPSFLPGKVKTPFIMFLLSTKDVMDKYLAKKELKDRALRSPLTPERVEYLIYQETGDLDKASTAKAQFILDMTRKTD